MIKLNSFGTEKILKKHFSVVHKTSNGYETWTVPLFLKPSAYIASISPGSTLISLFYGQLPSLP